MDSNNSGHNFITNILQEGLSGRILYLYSFYGMFLKYFNFEIVFVFLQVNFNDSLWNLGMKVNLPPEGDYSANTFSLTYDIMIYIMNGKH